MSLAPAFETTVVMGGFDEFPVDIERSGIRLVRCATAEEMQARLAEGEVAVLVAGPTIPAADTVQLLRQTPGTASSIAIGAGRDLSPFQDFIDNDRLYYISRGPLYPDEVRSLVLAAARRFAANSGATNSGRQADAACAAGPVLEHCLQISAQAELPELDAALEDAFRKTVKAAGAELLVYDARRQLLRSVKRTECIREESAAAGIVGYAVRTGEGVSAARAAEDGRYDPEADDPSGTRARLLVEPIGGENGRPIAAIAVWRNGDEPTFTAPERTIAALFAANARPALQQILHHERLESRLVEQTRSAVVSADLFRQEAIDHNLRSHGGEGDLIRTMPAWLKNSQWVTLACLTAALLYPMLARVDEYAEGPAVIRARSKITVSASTAGVARSVDVGPGDHVEAGDLLARIQDPPGASALDRFRAQLRSPVTGSISDIRVRPGQQVNVGDEIASVVNENAGYDLLSFLPGSYAPQLRPGAPITLTIDGYSDSHESASIATVANEIISPAEAARYAGKESAGVVNMSGPVVIVKAAITEAGFSAGERSYTYRDGMTCHVQSRVRSEPMALSLIPGLKDLYRSRLGGGK